MTVTADSLFSDILRAGLMVDNDWTVKQTDELDARTSHIYNCKSLRELQEQSTSRNLTHSEYSYAVHRWRNLKRHDAYLALLVEIVPGLQLYPDEFHKQRDFGLLVNDEVIYFDLKVTRYPRSAHSNLSDSELAAWLYKNQSKNSRHHLANRFFIIGQPESALYDISLARENLYKFLENMALYRHFITHHNGQQSRAVIIRQGVAPS